MSTTQEKRRNPFPRHEDLRIAPSTCRPCILPAKAWLTRLALPTQSSNIFQSDCVVQLFLCFVTPPFNGSGGELVVEQHVRLRCLVHRRHELY